MRGNKGRFDEGDMFMLGAKICASPIRRAHNEVRFHLPQGGQAAALAGRFDGNRVMPYDQVWTVNMTWILAP